MSTEQASDLAAVVKAHIEDLKLCVPTFESYGLAATAEAVKLAIEELSVALATPQPAAPLTRAQIKAAMLQADWPPSLIAPMVETKLIQFARAIEAAHGITPKEKSNA